MEVGDLTVTGPSGPLPLPVLVCFHGGGFVEVADALLKARNMGNSASNLNQ